MTCRFAVTGTLEDRGAFKTPTLRDVARTAPYMHAGSLATLGEVVELPYGSPATGPKAGGGTRCFVAASYADAALSSVGSSPCPAKNVIAIGIGFGDRDCVVPGGRIET